jgi:hypothetical protein
VVKVELSRYMPWRHMGDTYPRHWIGVSGQHHAPAALYPWERTPGTQEAGWAPEPVWTQRLEEKSSAPVGDRTPVVQSVVSHYTD